MDELKTAFFINRLKTTVSMMERAYGKVEVKCELCSDSGDKAGAFCRQCAMFICKNCIKPHKKLKILITHEVASLEDLKHGRAKPIVVKEDSASVQCTDHDEPLVIYCFDCDMLICRDCTIKDHRDHNFQFSKKVAATTKSNLLKKLEHLKTQSSSLSHAVEDVRTVKQELEAQRDTVANTIKTSFKELRDILDNRERELIGEADRLIQEKMDRLSVQEKTLSLANAEVQSVVDYTEQCVRHCTDNEVMSMHTEIRRRIERELDEYSKSGRSLEPVEEVDVGVDMSCAEALQQLCLTQANIIQLIDPAKCTVTMGDSTKHDVNETSHATLVTRLSSNKISRKHCNVPCSLRSLHNNVITECKVNQTGTGQYSIQCTPTVRGRHELTVSVDGQQVAGSPIPVFVSIPPTQLCKSVKVWTNLTKPTGITVNSVGEILVLEYRGTIIKFDTEGNRRTLVKRDRVLRKIAVDDEDNIYCIEENSNRILRCDTNGGNIQVLEVKHGRNGQRSLAVVGKEVMVGVKDNRGTIIVYDKELNYVRSIEHRDMGYFLAISADSHGNLYCADFNNGKIEVFSNDGVFLRSFGSDGKGEKKVKSPWGLCVSGHYVYVCNYGFLSNISVFTTDGVYVTSFGQCGSNEGDFNFPYSVCVDKDGFVYVTDYRNNRVQCF